LRNNKKNKIDESTKIFKKEEQELLNEKISNYKKSNTHKKINNIEDSNIEKISKKKKTKSKKRKFIRFIILILIIIGLINFFISYFRWKNIASAMIQNIPSEVIDTEGNTIALIGSEKITENVSLNDIPDNLKNAYISIEDQRFYKHKGVDIKRTGGATLSYISHFGKASFGGSTITQQLVKNLTSESASKISRKTKEWVKAFELETFLSKDEILEAYLNIIYVGPNIYGVASGSKYYFNKNISNLSLAECAFLAGINNAPISYNPFSEKNNLDKISKRTKIVLNKMFELKYINEDEYNQAIKDVESGLNFEKGNLESKQSEIYSYHTDALISEVISDLSNRKKISKDFAYNYLKMGGLKVYSTQDSKIQSTMESEFAKKTYILNSKNSNDTSQAAMVIIDHTTGHVVGCVGGLGEKNTNRSFNRATQSIRQTGSAIKPIAVLAPGIQNKIFTCTTIYSDTLTKFDDGSPKGYSPINYNTYLGDITVRKAVESSQNIPFVKMMEQLTPKTSIKYLKKLGITSLTDKDENLALALGGLDKGISPLEMASAYATFANEGVYIEPTFYTKIENSSGKKVLKTKQKTRKVFSKETCYIITQLLTQPVNGAYGTATYCALNGIEVAAKTGTTNNNYDRWLCEYTPYYTSVAWYGFDYNETINYNGVNPAGLISARIMANIHSSLPNKSFEKPKKIETATICAETGLVANEGCPDIYTEYFLSGTIPDRCDIHTSITNTNVKNTTTNTTQNQNINLEDEDIFKDKELPSAPEINKVTEPEPTVSETNTSINTVNTTNNSTNETTNNENTSNINNDTSSNNTINNNTSNTTNNTSNNTNTSNTTILSNTEETNSPTEHSTDETKQDTSIDEQNSNDEKNN